MSNLSLRLALQLVFIFLFPIGFLYAQTTTGSIRGTVTDIDGAVIVDAKVAIKNIGTNEERSTETNDKGEYSFAATQVATYLLTIESPGFQKFEYEIKVNINQVRTDLIILKIAAGTQAVVEVTSSTQPTVEMSSTQLGRSMESSSINELPLNNRDVFKSLLQLQPGVVSSTGSSTFVGDDRNLSVNGSRGRGNTYLINGGETNEPLDNAPTVEPPPDAIEEFRVITNTFDAEYGRNSGSVINLITRSGTNSFHGTAFEFFGNNKLNARGFFDPPEKPQYNTNQFGGVLGGPVVKDKQFFFFSYQSTIRREGRTSGAIDVPTSLERLGFFQPGSLGPEFPSGNISAQINPLSRKLLQFVPLANIGDSTFFAAPTRRLNDEQFTIKYDINTKNHRINAYYYFDDSFIFEPFSTFQNQTQTSILPGFGDETRQRNQNVNLIDTWIINPTTINQARFTYTRQAQGVFHTPVNRLDVTAFGFTGITPGLPGRTGVPYINVSGNFILGNNFESDQPEFGNAFQLAENISKLTSNHSFKFGGDFRRQQFNQIFFFDINGFFQFAGSSADSTGNPLADFLLGRPDSYIQGSPGELAIRTYSLDFYAQDSWRLRPNLTFNYGLRYQFDPPAIDSRNRIQAVREGQQSVVFPTAPLGLVFPGDPGVERGLAKTNNLSFAPRLGLAYSPNFKGKFLNKLTGGFGKTSIRAGFGIVYNPVEQLVLEQFTGQPPFGGSSSTSASTFADPFLLRNGTRLPNPFPVIPPKPGDRIDFSKFAPVVLFGQINPDLKAQYAIQYNLSIQRRIKNIWLINLAYVGSQGHHLLATYDLNPGLAGLCKSTPGCGPYGEDTAYRGLAGTRRFGNVNSNGMPFFSSVFTQDTIANSNYHSLQVSVGRAYSKGLVFEMAYTFSKSIDNASSFEQILNPFDYSLSRSLSQFDARHRLTFFYQYDLPLKRIFGNGPSALVEGWQINGITTFQSGFPIRLLDYTDASLTGGTASFETADTPDQIKPVQILDPRKNDLFYFNPSAFASVGPSEYGRFGTAGRQFFSGPGISNFDFSVIKTTPISEGKRLEFRLEIFNIFNHAQFFNPDGIITDKNRFGKVFRTRDPRIMQVALKLLF